MKICLRTPRLAWFCLNRIFDQLPLTIRYDVFHRERALTPGTPDWELETWTWKQKNPE